MDPNRKRAIRLTVALSAALLLASALIILPAAAARQLTDKLSTFLVVSVSVSLVSVLAGFFLNTFVLKLSLLGPMIVLFSAFFFALSMLARKA